MAQDKTAKLAFTAMLCYHSQQAGVEITLDGRSVQIDLVQARQVSDMLLNAIEVATSDLLMYRFLTESLGCSSQEATGILHALHQLRLGGAARPIEQVTQRVQ